MRFIKDLKDDLKALFADPSYLPAFLKKPMQSPSLHFEQAFMAQYGKYPQEIQNAVASQYAHLLLRTYTAQTLEGNVKNERAGFSPNVEAMLRSVLEMKNITINPDIVYGKPSPDILGKLEKLGLSPETEDDYLQLLQRLGISVTPKEPGSENKLEEAFEANFKTTPSVKMRS